VTGLDLFGYTIAVVVPVTAAVSWLMFIAKALASVKKDR